jgi:polyhydroxybutyrate depolymerase
MDFGATESGNSYPVDVTFAKARGSSVRLLGAWIQVAALVALAQGCKSGHDGGAQSAAADASIDVAADASAVGTGGLAVGAGGSVATGGVTNTTSASGSGGRSGKGGNSGGKGGVAGGTGGAPSGKGGAPSGTGGATGAGGTVGGDGCALSGQPTGDMHLSTTDGLGKSRDFEVMVPSSYQPGVALALVFGFHGAGGNQEGAKAGVPDAPDAAAGAIFAFAQGIPYQNYGVGWNDNCSGYDVVLFDNMIAALRAKYCIDPNRIFVYGFSWGCDFVTALLCCRGDRIRAVGAASCSDEFGNPADYKTYANYPCPTTSAAAVRFTHDSKDDGGYSAQQFASTSQLYRAINACQATSSPVSPSPCISYQGCAHPVIECSYDGLGHAVPAGFGQDTWAFFSEFR